MVVFVIYLANLQRPLTYSVDSHTCGLLIKVLDDLIAGRKKTEKVKVVNHTTVGVQTHALCLAADKVIAYEFIAQGE